ncbi:hypothetical protein [Vibrio phage BUCT006]|nr:hypothetical protein [Vibrio phage BUCT006]
MPAIWLLFGCQLNGGMTMKEASKFIFGIVAGGLAFGLCLGLFLIPTVLVITYVGRLVGACS